MPQKDLSSEERLRIRIRMSQDCQVNCVNFLIIFWMVIFGNKLILPSYLIFKVLQKSIFKNFCKYVLHIFPISDAFAPIFLQIFDPQI